MSFAPCIVIPIYNHRDAIGATVANLSVHGLPLFIVDDGSDEATQHVLAALRQQYAGKLKLIRLPVNGGKGAAVMAGLRAALEAGFTHGLQIDADGQHDAADVPRFIDAARAEPGAVILGRPVYDESVPKSRLYGRYLTHVWVWIETLSLTIRDSMCGFRRAVGQRAYQPYSHAACRGHAVAAADVACTQADAASFGHIIE
jgi:glycosyltransferase involved in cell wall biosynthesis